MTDYRPKYRPKYRPSNDQCVERYIGRRYLQLHMIQEYYDGDGKVVVCFLAVKSLHINYAKKETPMTNYSR